MPAGRESTGAIGEGEGMGEVGMGVEKSGQKETGMGGELELDCGNAHGRAEERMGQDSAN